MNLFAYVIMTNHIHAIIQSKKNDLSGLVRDFKKYTSKSILNEIHDSGHESRKEWLEMIFEYHVKFSKRAAGRQLWTHENHAIELSDNQMIDSRLEYIHQNPIRAGWVERDMIILYSSARNYSGMPGIIEIDLI